MNDIDDSSIPDQTLERCRITSESGEFRSILVKKLWVGPYDKTDPDQASSESETSSIPNQKCALDSVLDPPCPIRNKPDAFPMISVVKKEVFFSGVCFNIFYRRDPTIVIWRYIDPA